MTNVLKLVSDNAAPVPTAPRGLSKPARAEWRRLAPILRARGTLDAANEPMLAAYCGALVMIAAIDKQLIGADLIITGANGMPRPHPLVGARNRASQNALQLARRLGIIGNGTPPEPSKGGTGIADPYTALGI